MIENSICKIPTLIQASEPHGPYSRSDLQPDPRPPTPGLTRRALLSLPVALPLLHLAATAHSSMPHTPNDAYFPPPDAAGGWRTLTDPAQIRTRTGIDKARLDHAFQYVLPDGRPARAAVTS